MASEKQQLKTVLITGGGSGIGFATAKLLLETQKYRLVLLGRDRGRLEDAARSLGGSSATGRLTAATPAGIQKRREMLPAVLVPVR